MRNIFFISLVFAVLVSCTKARKCECVDSSLQAQQLGQENSVFYINGTKKDAKNACVNLADSTETCTLKDK